MSDVTSAEILAHPAAQQVCYLNVKSEYSLVDGSIKLDDYLQHMQALGHKYVALMDNGGLFGAFDFYLKCKARDMVPIIGATVYVKPSEGLVKFLAQLSPPQAQRRRGYEDILRPLLQEFELPPAFQLSLLAKNNQGYRTLTQLVSGAYTQDLQDDMPVCSWEFISTHLAPPANEDLIALAGGMRGELAYYARRWRRLTALPVELGHISIEWRQLMSQYMHQLQTLMGAGRLYLELFDYNLGYEGELMMDLAQLGADYGVPLVAAPEIYYLHETELETHLIALAIKNSLAETELQATRRDVNFQMPPQAKMEASYGSMRGALANTMVIAEACGQLNWQTDEHHLPSFPVPAGEQHLTEDAWLERVARQGLRQRLEGMGQPSEDDYVRRLEYELEVVKTMGFSGYFLIVQDFIRWAKEQGIPVGPGRGSGAGSLMAYSLGITEIDPLRWGLLFERFLNPERISLPDFDIDFCQWRREEVIRYVIQKYGQDKVAHICSFGKLMAKAALKSVARVMGIHFLKMNELTKLFPPDMSLSLREVLASTPQLAEEVQKDDRLSRALNIALKLEGMVAHTSVHPAGVVISDRPIIHDVPTFMTSKDQCVMSQYEMKSLEKSGLVKFDFLGLKTLTVIDHACREIGKARGEPFEIATIPLDDGAVFGQLAAGHTVGVFQAESAGMTALARKLKPTHFEDIIALVALFRPGPLGSGMVDDFIERKHQRQPITYLHPLLKPFLAETYGMIVYQEQVQQIASALAQYSLGEADLLRRAMGKKIAGEMQQQQERFIQGAQQQDISQGLAVKIFELMAEFAKYGFNKSHSAAYGLILYQTAYLKTHYPAEFMVALMNSDMDLPQKMAAYIQECARLGITVVPPALHQSYSGFVLRQGQIRYALHAIKGISKRSLELMMAERDKQPFTNMLDFAQRCNLQQMGQKNVELLNKVGVFDEFGFPRTKLRTQISRWVAYSGHYHTKQQQQSGSLLALMLAPDSAPAAGLREQASSAASVAGDSFHSAPKWYEELKTWQAPAHECVSLGDLIDEKGLLGSYMSAHPLQYFSGLIQLLEPTTSIAQLRQGHQAGPSAYDYSKGDHRLVMYLEQQFESATPSGQQMMRFYLESYEGDGVLPQRVEGVLYDQELAKHVTLPKNHRLVVVTGYLRSRGRNQFVIKTIEDAMQKLCREPMDVGFEIMVADIAALDRMTVETALLHQLSEFCQEHPGETAVTLIVMIPSPMAEGEGLKPKDVAVQLCFELTTVDQQALVNDFLLTKAFQLGGLTVRKDYTPRHIAAGDA